ncbi:MAG TPA: ABC transporter ATP-binding protein [Stellaceae bacterium]|nr:ABC transporter ATP-binding protein [Stellaceae bacterium]
MTREPGAAQPILPPPIPRPSILRLDDVSAGYGKVATIRQIGFELAPGESAAVIGANGAGKTSMLRAIMGEIRTKTGDIAFDGVSMRDLPTFQRARLGIGYAPEGRQLFPSMSVVENLEIGAARMEAGARRRRIGQMVDIFPKLQPLLETHCCYLSGGEQQMVTIARALMNEPRLLILDEPSTGLAPRVISELYASLATLLPTGLTILVAEQNARAALRFASRAIVLEDGHIVAAGPSASLRQDRRVVEAYVGGLAAVG